MLNSTCNNSYNRIPNEENAFFNYQNDSDKMGELWNKFRLLMWKNWLLQYRKPIQTVIEILAPVVFSIILVIIRNVVNPEPHNAIIYEPFSTIPIQQNVTGINAGLSSDFQKILKKLNKINADGPSEAANFTTTILYSPINNTAIDQIMKILELVTFSQRKGFKNAVEMEQFYVTNNANNMILCGIQFEDNLAYQTDPENLLGANKNVKVALRFPSELRFGEFLLEQNDWHTNLIYPVFQSAGPRNPNSTTGASPNYYKESFLFIQHCLSLLITLYNGNKFALNEIDKIERLMEISSTFPVLTMRRFPYANWNEDLLLTALKSFVSIIVMLSFVYTCINTVKAITTEKEKQLKEAMKIMGLPNWLHWIAWFLKTFSYLMLSIILMVVLLKVHWYTNTEYTVFTYANPIVLLIFLFFYVCSIITFCFAISVFFSKANTAATIAGLAWFLSYAPYSFIQNKYDTLSLSTKLITSLGSNTAMAFGFQIILMYEGTGEGVQFNNIWKPNTPDDNISLGIIMLILTIDSILYLLIALYVEAVFPGSYGVPLKWYFPFTSSYWCGELQNKGVAVDNFEDINATTNNSEFFENEPKHLPTGIRILNLRKLFNKKAAVRNLTLNIFEDQITVLLGHNGAGKTTTMSMLTGMFTPTSGTAIVSGYDIRTDMNRVRNSLGLCPQHNIIFDELTVAEHLYFFSKLKGMRGSQIEQEITKYVDLLELQPKRNSKSASLSGGMKRKLCVGIALCGNSKVVMLDEPTAGMDPSARRALWDLLLKQKPGRTMLLTTHFMDEADLLGDRIAIMAGGELQCCGSSFFLKKKYGAGYHLIMDKSVKCNPTNVTKLLRKYIPNIEIHSNVGSELTYLLAESQSSSFEAMLRDLEQHSEILDINSYGISLTTLEEVFMKVGADHGQEETYNDKQNGVFPTEPVVNSETTISVEIKAPHTISSWELLKNQILAMTLKKLLSTLRSWVLLLIQIIIPSIFLIISMIVAKQQNRLGALPEMPLDLSKYEQPVTLIEGAKNGTGFEKFYKEIVGNAAYKEVDSIQETILKLTAENPGMVRRNYIGGVSFSSIPNPLPVILPDLLNYTVYFNNDPYHTPAVALNLALNSIYQEHLNCSNCTIKISNFPMPYSEESQLNQLTKGNSLGFQLSFNICFSMAFVSSFYVFFVIRERMSKSKHLQFVSGVKVSVFWFTSLFWDFLTYIITIIPLLITLMCFREDGFKSPSDISRLALILIYFGWSMLPLMYLAGFLFDIPSTGYTRMTLFSIFTGCAAFLVVQVLKSADLGLEYVANTLHWIFLTVPHYSLASGIQESYTLFFYNNLCDKLFLTCQEQFPNITREQCYFNISKSVSGICIGLDDNYYKWKSPGIGRNLFFSITGGFILLLVLLISEYKIFTKIFYKIEQKYNPKGPLDMPEEDSDVKNEKLKIRNSNSDELFQEEYTMVVKDLTKYYKKLLAVNGLCLGVKKYECFGLLGINGAGKTTTFKMLTGDENISYGDAWISRKSIKNDIKQVQKLIGYCPQFDALLDDLTARETIKMFSLLRGIPNSYCNDVAEKLARDFDFYRHLDKKIKELSGGNKRKLSTSIALIGDPPVIYLDEPTTGMDPATKRYLWNALCQVRDSGKTIILTSHSMEECEALCTRLAIMVNGNFKCLGSTQHLKWKFAEGYTLTIKVTRVKEIAANMHSDTTKLENFMRENFPGSVLREKHDELLTYYIVDKTVSWSKMFGILENAKRNKDLSIEDYSLGQSSLEQVFLTFTKHQYQIE